MSCKSSSSGHGGRSISSLQNLVDTYLDVHRGKELPTKEAYQQLSEAAAIEKAARLLVLTKSGNGWKKHSHFHRPWFYKKYKASFEKAASVLLENQPKLRAAVKRGFESVHCEVRNLLCPIAGLKDLAYYDITETLGYHYEFEPCEVYLHAGTLRGAHALLGKSACRPNTLLKSAFPEELQPLAIFEIEDFLCLFHKEIAKLRSQGVLS